MKTMGTGYFESVSVSSWKLSTFMSIMTQIRLNMRIWEPFRNKSGVIVSSENVWTSNNVQMLDIW